ncbi:MAG: DUF1810 family protein [Oscillospiraceae bacterium]|nr:DUF1810 family protein [Oscillospiraceae bacterium]
MHYQMKLNEKPFRALQAGYKSIELRLNDEKRQQLQTGDEITFTCIPHPEESITKKIKALYKFADFAELFASLPLLKCGETPFSLPEAKPEQMNLYYSQEQQKKYQALGIALEEVPLQRFLAGQTGAMPDCSGYETALKEIRSGYKSTHWIWYILPQIKGLTPDTVTEYYALENKQEARAFLHHPVLGVRLLEMTEALLQLQTSDPVVIFGLTDAYKLRNCMTLFAEIAPEQTLFADTLSKFCLDTKDEKTLQILSHDKS